MRVGRNDEESGLLFDIYTDLSGFNDFSQSSDDILITTCIPHPNYHDNEMDILLHVKRVGSRFDMLGSKTKRRRVRARQ